MSKLVVKNAINLRKLLKILLVEFKHFAYDDLLDLSLLDNDEIDETFMRFKSLVFSVVCSEIERESGGINFAGLSNQKECSDFVHLFIAYKRSFVCTTKTEEDLYAFIKNQED